VAYYRVGKYPEAVAALEKTLLPGWRKGGGTLVLACNPYFLATCHARLGDAAKAKDCYDRAVRWMQEQQSKLPAEEQKELIAFRAEAEAVLQKASKP
jgi:hypothetical protein